MTWRFFAAVAAVIGMCVLPTCAHAGSSRAKATPSGCQFLTVRNDTPAFCDDFSEGPSAGGREGQLNPARWSVSRYGGGQGALPDAWPWASTPITPCRAGTTSVQPDNDILVCDPASGHAGQIEMGMSAQNYAFEAMRPRQPIDFARGATITLNVDAMTLAGLSWWPSVWITDEPYAGATNSAENDAMLPRNGIGINFDSGFNYPQCVESQPHNGVGGVFTYRNFVETWIPNPDTNPADVCINTKWGALNHIEIHLSQTKVSVWASDFSPDGITYPNFRKVYSSPISLNFSTGYVIFEGGERAPLKYENEFNIHPPYLNYYWSDLGFDGPVVKTGEVGYQVPDSLTPAIGSPDFPGARNVAYAIFNHPHEIVSCCGASGNDIAQELQINKVSLTGVQSAALSFDVAYTFCCGFTPPQLDLMYNLNGTGWRHPDPGPNGVAEIVCGGCPGPGGAGGMPYYFPVPLSLLHAGTNTINFGDPISPNGYPPKIANVDLDTFTTPGGANAGG